MGLKNRNQPHSREGGLKGRREQADLAREAERLAAATPIVSSLKDILQTAKDGGTLKFEANAVFYPGLDAHNEVHGHEYATDAQLQDGTHLRVADRIFDDPETNQPRACFVLVGDKLPGAHQHANGGEFGMILYMDKDDESLIDIEARYFEDGEMADMPKEVISSVSDALISAR